MAHIRFGTQNPIPYTAYEYDGMTVGIKGSGDIIVDKEVDASQETLIKSNAIAAMQQALGSVNAKQIRCTDLAICTKEISDAIKMKLAEIGYDAKVTINNLIVDSESSKRIEDFKNKNAAVVAGSAQAQAVSPSRPKFCPNCGTPTGVSGNFCSNCGSRLM